MDVENKGEVHVYKSEDGLTHIDVKMESERIYIAMLRDSIRELEAKWVGISIIEDLKNNDENLYNYVVETCIIGIKQSR